MNSARAGSSLATLDHDGIGIPCRDVTDLGVHEGADF